MINRDDLKASMIQSRETKLRINHVAMTDSIWDPFEEQTDDILFL